MLDLEACHWSRYLISDISHHQQGQKKRRLRSSHRRNGRRRGKPPAIARPRAPRRGLALPRRPMITSRWKGSQWEKKKWGFPLHQETRHHSVPPPSERKQSGRERSERNATDRDRGQRRADRHTDRRRWNPATTTLQLECAPALPLRFPTTLFSFPPTHRKPHGNMT